MPLHFDISRINEPDDTFEPNDSDFYDDIEDWYSEDEEENEINCWHCDATGEGATSELRCSYCHGRGTIKKKKY